MYIYWLIRKIYFLEFMCGTLGKCGFSNGPEDYLQICEKYSPQGELYFCVWKTVRQCLQIQSPPARNIRPWVSVPTWLTVWEIDSWRLFRLQNPVDIKFLININNHTICCSLALNNKPLLT